MTLLRNLLLVLTVGCTIGFVGCSDDDDKCEKTCAADEILTIDCECVKTGVIDPETEEELAAQIDANRTLTADKIYYLSGKTYVTPGTTLTIEPGTIIKGKPGIGSLASALIVARGAKIEACGTADNPIIFTSSLDNIKIGEKSGTNLGKEDREKWGGLIVLGKAPISAKDGDTETQVEGIPGDVEFGKFGGSDANDSSGSMCYLSIRHGGALIGADNEINGLTLGGVGNGTTINNIEVIGNLDDGVEFFGGTVDVNNILVAYQGDDAVDIDMNYSGTIDNVYIIHGGDDTDEAFEIDGPENSTYADGQFTITNATAIAEDQTKTSGADLKSKAQGLLKGVSFQGYKPGKFVKVRANFDVDNNCAEKSDAYTNLAADKLMVMNCEMVTGEISELDEIGTVYTDPKASNAEALAACLENSNNEANADAKISANGNTIVGSGTKGARTNEFDWTWAKSNDLVK